MVAGFRQHSGETQNVAQSEVGVGAVGPAAHEVLGLLVRMDKVAAFDSTHDEPGGGGHVIRIEREGPFHSRLVAFHQSRGAAPVARLHVIPSGQSDPGRRVGWVELHRFFQHGGGFRIRRRLERKRCAPEEQPVGLFVFRLRPGIDGVYFEFHDLAATFLPQVWNSIPEPLDFLGELRRKAGLPPRFWHPDVRLSRYTVEKYQ